MTKDDTATKATIQVISTSYKIKKGVHMNNTTQHKNIKLFSAILGAGLVVATLAIGSEVKAGEWVATQPDQLAITEAALTSKSYTLQSGDTLWALSQRVNVSVKALALYNQIDLSSGEECALAVGQVISWANANQGDAIVSELPVGTDLLKQSGSLPTQTAKVPKEETSEQPIPIAPPSNSQVEESQPSSNSSAPSSNVNPVTPSAPSSDASPSSQAPTQPSTEATQPNTPPNSASEDVPVDPTTPTQPTEPSTRDEPAPSGAETDDTIQVKESDQSSESAPSNEPDADVVVPVEPTTPPIENNWTEQE